MVLLIVLYVIIVLAIILTPRIIVKREEAAQAAKAAQAALMKQDEPVAEKEPETIIIDVHERIIKKVHAKFDQYIMVERGYLDPEISVESLSKLLDTNRTYISEVVNTKYGMSFRELMCKLRIDHAKKLLLEQPYMSITIISGQSGFIGPNQFVRKFKEMEGITPAAWRADKLNGDLKIC